MRRLYDASAIVNILVRADAHLPRIRKGLILDLTSYEVGNALVKIARDGGGWQRSQVYLDTWLQLKRRLSAPLRLNRLEHIVLRMSERAGLTFYDAAYVVACPRTNADLVTDDRQMRDAAQDLGVRAFSSSDL